LTTPIINTELEREPPEFRNMAVANDDVNQAAVSTAGAGSSLLTGGGTGGLLVFLITNYIVDVKLQTVALYCCPTASICATWFHSRVKDWFEEKRQAKRLKQAEAKRNEALQKARAGLAAAREDLKRVEEDAKATEQHRIEVRKRVEEFERAVLKLQIDGSLTIES
jgi:hypothetical protein